MLIIPGTSFRTLGTTPLSVRQRLKDARVHAILAANLILDKSPEMAIWSAVLPTMEDFQMLMPFCWTPDLQAFLPHSSSNELAKQKAAFSNDWEAVNKAYEGEITKDDFLYAWLLVNTRTFYYTDKSTKGRPTEDHMILQPVADLLNHSAHGCSLSFEGNEFTVTTVRDHEPGEEIFISYGSHSNDFLLVQYGFVLPSSSNPWDEICLDPYIVPELIAAGKKDRLEEAGFWGRYMLDSETPCYRTDVALRALCLTPTQWEAALTGERDEDIDRAIMNEELVKILQRAEVDADAKLAAVSTLTVGDEAIRLSLKARWLQMGALLRRTISRLT